MQKHKVLIVEDDPFMGVIIKECFEEREFEAELCDNGEAGFQKFFDWEPDIAIFDVMMPLKDGFTLAEEIRQKDKHTPIIFLTAKSLKEDVLKGFKIGADDYMKKPFSMEELIARVNVFLKRSQANFIADKYKEEFTVGEFVFDFRNRTLTHPTEVKTLTTKEAQLFKLLCLHKGNILNRKDTLNELWTDDGFFQARSMDVYIAKLRKYLKLDPRVQIVNIRGEGFKLVD